MEIKLFELRDTATFVPAMAIKLDPRNAQERWLLRRAGYGPESDMILMCGLSGGTDTITCDPYDWGGNRTRIEAHDYIQKHWDELVSGQVICTEFLRGERTEPKISERLTDPSI